MSQLAPGMSKRRGVADIVVSEQCLEYREQPSVTPMFFCGDALALLRDMPSDYFDCCMTSPPYWGHRQYETDGIGLEAAAEEYIENLMAILAGVKRVMKPTGSFWLNIGDSYISKGLAGIPWRIALRLIDEHGLILRNSVIWHKVKGAPDNSKDKLRCVHENLFHFVKARSYYYDADAIRSAPRSAKVENGRVVSATGVSGIRYRRQIELSTALSEPERRNALLALEQVLLSVKAGRLSDFRMIIRGQQRTTHSDGEKVSGRARELKESGFWMTRTSRLFKCSKVCTL